MGLELDKEHHALFVAFGSCLVRVPLSRCGRHGACKRFALPKFKGRSKCAGFDTQGGGGAVLSRRACLASRDPYCIWLRTGRCADTAPGFKYVSLPLRRSWE